MGRQQRRMGAPSPVYFADRAAAAMGGSARSKVPEYVPGAPAAFKARSPGALQKRQRQHERRLGHRLP